MPFTIFDKLNYGRRKRIGDDKGHSIYEQKRKINKIKESERRLPIKKTYLSQKYFKYFISFLKQQCCRSEVANKKQHFSLTSRTDQAKGSKLNSIQQK